MEKITGKQVETMMEAYASIYNNQEQEFLKFLRRLRNFRKIKQTETSNANSARSKCLVEHSSNLGQNQEQVVSEIVFVIEDLKVKRMLRQIQTKQVQTFTPAQVAALKKPAAPTVLADKTPSANPNVTPGGTKFERTVKA